ncbi:MAG TPA: head decoration protein, partial [Pseudomonadales bacterium]|nr:head decoration protein [Pseudomonadales bacterium]
MTTLTKYLGTLAFLLSEAMGARSRAQIIVAESMTLLAGAVLGQIKFGTITAAPDGGNTGDGTVGTLTAGRLAVVGDYVLTCIAASANAGTFQVVTPDGTRLADATVAVAYANDHLGFTIADGAADFIVGDVLTITVPEGSLQYVELDVAGEDGSQFAAGILGPAVTTGVGETEGGVAVVRDAEVNGNEITWPAGITEAQKAVAT